MLLPFYNRPQFYYALASFKNLHYRDFEIVVVEDSKNYNDKVLHEQLLEIINKYDFNIRLLFDTRVSYNSASKYNVAAHAANSDIFILSNPETRHTNNILSYLDNKDFVNNYYVFDCMSCRLIDDKLVFIQWYQHRTINRQYHFCSAISRANYFKIGGFDERLCNGIAYEDDFFIRAIKKHKINVVCIDDIYVQHIEHNRDYMLDSTEKARLVKINEELWRAAQHGL